MGKLPKELQQKRDHAKALRSQGGIPPKTAGSGGKMMNRQMRRRMEQQGMEGMEQIDATRVIIQTAEEDLVITSPQVIKVKQQGMEVYQIIGSAESQEPGQGFVTARSPTDAIVVDHDETGTIADDEGSPTATESLNVEITDQDVQLVAMQTGSTPEVARRALEDTNGDLAKAIMNLKMR